MNAYLHPPDDAVDHRMQAQQIVLAVAATLHTLSAYLEGHISDPARWEQAYGRVGDLHIDLHRALTLVGAIADVPDDDPEGLPF